MYYIVSHATDTWVYEQCALRGIPLGVWSKDMGAIYSEWEDVPLVTRQSYIEQATAEYHAKAHERSMRRVFGKHYPSA